MPESGGAKKPAPATAKKPASATAKKPASGGAKKTASATAKKPASATAKKPASGGAKTNKTASATVGVASTKPTKTIQKKQKKNTQLKKITPQERAEIEKIVESMRNNIQELAHLSNNDVINKFVDFLIKSGKHQCTKTTVVDDFCSVISYTLKMKPPKQLTPTIIMDLVDEMNGAAMTAGWGTSQRKWIINKILNMFGDDELDDTLVAETRNWFTPTGDSLTKVTMEAAKSIGGMYDSRTYEDSTQPTQQYTPLEEMQQVAHSRQWIPQGEFITFVERKQCAICWMCGLPIYVYKITVNSGNIYYHSCGQDEHVLPPGWGNILGILWSDLKDQRMYNSCPSSLSPSHTWCNQLKNDELLLLLPSFTFNPNQYNPFKINDQGFNRFVTKGIKWLTTGKNIEDHNMFYKNLANPPNVDFLNKPTAVLFMQSMEQTMRLYLMNLIGEMENITNSKLTDIDEDHIIVFMLRTILMLANIRTKIMTIRFGVKTGGTLPPPPPMPPPMPPQTDADMEGEEDEEYEEGGKVNIKDILNDPLARSLYTPMILFRNETRVSKTEDPERQLAFDDSKMLNYIAAATLKLQQQHTQEQQHMQLEATTSTIEAGDWRTRFRTSRKAFKVYVYGIEKIILEVYKPPYINLPNLPSLYEQMVEPESTYVEVDTSWPVQQAIFGQGGKHKSQKYKSQKYKTRKHKSQKQKNRKKHKSRKHKSRKHK